MGRTIEQNKALLASLDSALALVEHAQVNLTKQGAEIEGLLPDSSDASYFEAMTRVKALFPADADAKKPDSLRSLLGDTYDSLPCTVRPTIIALGVLAYAHGIGSEVGNRIAFETQKEALFQELNDALADPNNPNPLAFLFGDDNELSA